MSLTRLRGRFVGVLLAAVTATASLALPAKPANAVDPGTVAAAAQAAYSAYQKFVAHELTLQQATTQIINAIDAAKTQIIAHVDRLAAADARACTRAAVI